jgi:chromosome segregation ATPase
MRDGLPEAKSCMQELASMDAALVEIDRRCHQADVELDEARERFEKLDQERRKMSAEIASYNRMVISNLDYEIREQLPSMWGHPVKITITENA